jgi:2-polyprenyl-6-methoxyphenol hydroxylase-like FAD-dependent oxidoreductase
MAHIVVCGGSVIGLAAAMMLADDGHDVTILEGDATPAPLDAADAWETWPRTGVAQFHQPHNLFPRAREVLDAELPGLMDDLVAAGGRRISPVAVLPPTITDRSAQPGDERFNFVNSRRPVMEAVFAHAAARHAGVTILRGVMVDGLRTTDGDTSVPHVTGLRTDGNVRDADLVVDAMGRRTKLPEWVQQLGAGTPHVESEDSGFVYYTRYYRGPDMPPLLAPGLSPIGSLSLLTLQSDNDTWSITLFGPSADHEVRGLRDPERFERVVRACPLHAHWLEGEPFTEIVTMAGVLDRYRRYVRDDQPLVTGVVPVGDAWACTNPSAGRGVSVGLVHAQQLRAAVRAGIDDADVFVRNYDAATEMYVTPFYRNQIAADRVRIAEMDALRRGEPPPPPDPAMAARLTAMRIDPIVYRGMVEILTCLALPQEVFARPEFNAAVAPFADQVPAPMPSPDRDELIALLR